MVGSHNPRFEATINSPINPSTGDERVRAQLEVQTRRRISRCNDSSQIFLKSRPPHGSIERTHPSCREAARAVTGEALPDVVEVDHFKGHPCAWQQSETIDAFLKRLPVGDPNTSTLDGWLWVGSPKQPYAHVKSHNVEDLSRFIESGNSLLANYLKQQKVVEAELAGRAQAAITRRMGAYRDQLECEILSCAVKNGLTFGKWMLFPTFADLARTWRLVATATSEGRLGPTAKSAVFDPSDRDTVICVYTYDFTDSGDVRRVLEELVELGVYSTERRRIYYKCDAYTHLGIASKNAYHLRASLYSSTEILQNEAKAFANGSVARLKKNQNKKKMEDFFSMFSDDLV